MVKTMNNYTEFSKLETFEERFDYLKLEGSVGAETFGYDRYLNQALYNSREWRKIRNEVIIRDLGCDLGVEGYPITKKPIIHHMNPITREQIENRDPIVFDPEYLITVTHETHNAIHYGDSKEISKNPIERTKGDTCPWKVS